MLNKKAHTEAWAFDDLFTVLAFFDGGPRCIGIT
jgi:hypothetical protein